ncbi:MAG: class I SAM-dependent methyltransferase, partial [Gammaproteobacteria bacterium]|nr:class I SAM-dependent methyltransferase [Gammaproteobacteria bacterium]
MTVGHNGFERSLQAALEALAEPLPAAAAEQCADFLRLLTKWNQTWNLTAVRDPEEMVTRHLADSLSVRGWLVGESIADVGS